LTGEETFEITGLENGLVPRMHVHVRAADAKGRHIDFRALLRIDTPDEAEYYRHGGILQYMLRQLRQKQTAGV
jgi:aconitate hydratase